jgi:hypothetical protein
MKKYIILILVVFTNACAETGIKIGNESYSFVNSESANAQSTNTHNNGTTLVNQRTGETAIITGNLVVKLTKTDAETIANRYGLSIQNNFKHLNLVFFNTHNQDVFELKNLMSQDSEIDSVEVDLIENLRVPY